MVMIQDQPRTSPQTKKNLKLLGRIDWNITNGHKLSVRYNYTKNTAWNAPNANSMDGGSGSRLYNTSRVGYQSMSLLTACIPKTIKCLPYPLI